MGDTKMTTMGFDQKIIVKISFSTVFFNLKGYLQDICKDI